MFRSPEDTFGSDPVFYFDGGCKGTRKMASDRHRGKKRKIGEKLGFWQIGSIHGMALFCSDGSYIAVGSAVGLQGGRKLL